MITTDIKSEMSQLCQQELMESDEQFKLWMESRHTKQLLDLFKRDLKAWEKTMLDAAYGSQPTERIAGKLEYIQTLAKGVSFMLCQREIENKIKDKYKNESESPQAADVWKM